MATKPKTPVEPKTPAKPKTSIKPAVKSDAAATPQKSSKPVAGKPKAAQASTPKTAPKTIQDSKSASGDKVAAGAKASSSSPASPTAGSTDAALSGPVKQKSRSSIGMVMIGLVIVGLVIGAGTSRQYWMPQVNALLDRMAMDEGITDEAAQVDASEQAAQLKAVEDARSKQEMAAFAEQENARVKVRQDMAVILNRLEGVEGSMRDLKQMAAAVSNNDATEDARSTLNVLTQRLQVIEQRNQADNAARDKDGAALVNITQRINALEAASASNNTARVMTQGDAIVRASSLVLAVGQLRAIVRQGLPYDGELSAVIATADNRENIQSALDVLAVHAKTGVKQLGVLRASFEDAILDAVKADAAMQQDGWVNDVLNELSGLVVIRKIDGLAGLDTVDARISRAQSSLGEGDLLTVIGVIEGLDQPAAQAFDGWLTDAQSFMATERALDNLYSHVIAQLASMKG